MTRDPFDDANDPYPQDEPRDAGERGELPTVSRRAVTRALVVLPAVGMSVGLGAATEGCAAVPRACVPRAGWTGSCRQRYCRYYRA